MGIIPALASMLCGGIPEIDKQFRNSVGVLACRPGSMTLSALIKICPSGGILDMILALSSSTVVFLVLRMLRSEYHEGSWYPKSQQASDRWGGGIPIYRRRRRT
eukprot:GHVQ01039934.1.p2 GENE.GHVQ01039934.1~~GHVQ01039934.1.p2  ORF type:complete len:104 (-),score=7.39 GHVQ01039934.1:360-671(-)